MCKQSCKHWFFFRIFGYILLIKTDDMEATELRIGNLLTLDENQRRDLWYDQIHAMNDNFKVVTVYSDGDIALELDDEVVDISVKDVSPIPLTEEWLLKFGFEIEDNTIVNNPIQLYKQDGIYWCDILWDSIEIKYVHQLQNLYHSLTGKELSLTASTPQR